MANGSSKNNQSKAVANLPNDSSTNKSVNRIYNKSNSKPKTKVDTNKAAIMQIARDVKVLQNQRYGEVQSAIEVLNLVGDSRPFIDQPVCFPIDNFYNNSPVYKGTLVSGVPGFVITDNFNRLSYQSDMNDQFEWCARMNTDQVSSIQYKPLSTRLNFEVNLNAMNTATADAMKLRVTLLKVKPITLEGSVDCSLPTRLGAYRNLAGTVANTNTNYLTPRLHDVLYDKVIKVGYDTTRPTRQVKFSIPYTFKNSHIITPDFTTQPPGQIYITAVPNNEIIWCLISVSDDASTKLNGIKISRYLKWRDRDGVQG